MTILFQLDASLDYIREQGLGPFFARKADVADQVRKLITGAGLEIYAQKPGNGITGVIPPAGFDIAGFKNRLESLFGIQIAGGWDP